MISSCKARGFNDGSYMDGVIAHAYRPDSAVIYSNGGGAAPLACPGDWVSAIANAAKCNAVPPLCTAPDTLVCDSDCTGDEINLTWNNSDTYDSIIVRRDGVDIATLAGTATSYADVGVAPGSYSYIVVGECSGSLTFPAVCSASHCMDDFILVLDWVSNSAVAQTALTNLGLPFTLTVDSASFEAELAITVAPLVVVDNPSNLLTANASLLLADYIDNGGSVLLSYWDLDTDLTLQTAFGVASAFDFTIPQEVFAWEDTHPIWNDPSPLVSVPVGVGDPWIDDGDTMTVGVDAEALGGFLGATPAAGQAGIIVANDDRTIVNGFTYDQLDFTSALALVENEITFLLGGGGPTDPGYLRGDVNSDGVFDISDGVFTLAALFVPGSPTPLCQEAADINSDGVVDISDAVYALAGLFVPGSPTPLAPFPDCDDAPAPLGCDVPQC